MCKSVRHGIWNIKAMLPLGHTHWHELFHPLIVAFSVWSLCFQKSRAVFCMVKWIKRVKYEIKIETHFVGCLKRISILMKSIRIF